MNSLKKATYLATSFVVIIGLFVVAAVPANARHEIGYSCETACIVLVDPETKLPNIVDCCGGWVSAKRVRHDRIFTFWN